MAPEVLDCPFKNKPEAAKALIQAGANLLAVDIYDRIALQHCLSKSATAGVIRKAMKAKGYDTEIDNRKKKTTEEKKKKGGKSRNSKEL